MNEQKTILFILGCAQKARDGVADYTLRLAHELESKGIRCRLLGWNETSLQAPVISENLIRVPAALSWRAKLNLIKPWYDQAPPDKVSLQFVPYAFDSAGLPERLATEISPAIAGKPLHIFMHELWVMPCMRARLKDKLLGYFLQKKVVLKTLRDLNPALIHAAVPHYVRTLEHEKFPQTRALPLFGNLPFHPITHPPFDGSSHASNERRIGFFGSLHHPIDPFCRQLKNLSQKAGTTLTLFWGGHGSDRAKSYWEGAKKRHACETLRFETFGHLAPREASYYLQTLHFVASTYSPVFYPKSGVIAAAREHGKAVILLGATETLTHPSLPEGVYSHLTPELLLNPPTPAHYNPLSTVAETYEHFIKS